MNLSEILSHFSEDRYEEADGLVLHCPAHNDSKPSLKLALTDEGKVLIACRAGCSTPEVLQAANLKTRDLFNVTDDEGVATTSQKAELTPGDIGKLSALLAQTVEAGDDPNAPHWEYLQRRFGLDRSTATALGLGFDPADGTVTSSLKGRTWDDSPRLVVPFRDFDGHALGAQARALDKECSTRWCSLSGNAWSKMAVFDAGSGLDTWVVTEGPTDALALVAAGFNAVAIRGAALKGNGPLLRQLVAGLHGHKVYVCGDADDSGRGFAEELATRLIEQDVDALIMDVPDGANDLAAAYEANPEGFLSAVDASMRQAASPIPQAPSGPTQASHDGHPLTDVGNAHRLVEGFSGDLAYNPSTGWLVYDSGIWTKDSDSTVRAAAHGVSFGLISAGRELVATANGDAAKEAKGKKLITFGERTQTSQRIDALMKEAPAVRGVTVAMERFDRHPHLVAVRNGVVDLRNGQLLPHDRELMLTRRVDVDYNPAAKAPRWEQFLTEVFPTQVGMAEYMQRLVGYGITGLTTEQCFAILWGTGANGKSVFTDTLAHVFSAISNTTPFSTFERNPSGGGIPNDIAALQGARLVFASEGDQGALMNEAILKRLSGSDLITARFMRREFFTFHPTFLLWMATNYKPSFRGQDEGLWRRVKLIPFTRRFAPEERDHYLTDHLKGEAEGILAWSVEGARQWFAHGLKDPPEVERATASYRSNQDALEGFFPGMYQRVTGAKALAADVYKDYVKWTETEELPFKERWSRRALYAAFDERGVERVKRNDGVWFLGAARAEDLPPEEPLPIGVPIQPSVENKEGQAPVSQSLDDIF